MNKIFIIFLALLSLITLTTRAATEAEITALRDNVPLLNAFRQSCKLSESDPIDAVIDTIKNMGSLDFINTSISSFEGMPELPNLAILCLVRSFLQRVDQ